MTKANSKSIALITPLKDEIENIDRFIDSLQLQTMAIKILIIVENDSTDGSKEHLNRLVAEKNIECLEVINITFDDKSYRVGKKYASIISVGLEHLKGMTQYDEVDFVGILDCDVFPEKEYYDKLTNFLNNNSEIGIASGLAFTPEGIPHIADPNFVRGNSRLWKKECLESAGYMVVPTADTVSVALAHLKGWKTKTLKSAKVVSREIDVRLTNPQSKGYHAYFRGHTLFYMILKLVHFGVIKRRFKTGRIFLSGYLKAMFGNMPRIENKEVKNYFKFYYFNKLMGKFK